jgi:hypothetical protein
MKRFLLCLFTIELHVLNYNYQIYKNVYSVKIMMS